ncbi:hypothetical protein BWQ96_03876 [Gracilariopsis chorda]|uniref:F-box/LRR-repeat protein 15-like leucin rich repeat domain-containing protein n=1 Tax=Gracilariopsis chorda TaxID=448386 RepID=A0A2V3IXF7_9FLOR|nr:hypothetical protein BWQ96_03876 [Gracilariopsis chorda]|eukprot:PXF46377.1 hypothetical protein BWQ96_03876 [Gracilariopsis chorda]
MLLRAANLIDLPDDVLLRILSLCGPLRAQVGTAFRLGCVCVRLRRLLLRHYLPALCHVTSDAIYTLSLADANAARAALDAMFAATSSLKTLNLSGCSPRLISQTTISSLVAVAKHSLTEVNFAHCALTDNVLAPFMTCPNLRTLILPSSRITGSMFLHAKRVAPLEKLDLSWVHSLTPEGVVAVANIVTLKTLCLKGCDAVNRESLNAFLNSDIRKSLRTVSFAFCPLRNQCLIDFLRRTPYLKELILAENRGNIWPQGLYTATGIHAIRLQFPHVNVTFVT